MADLFLDLVGASAGKGPEPLPERLEKGSRYPALFSLAGTMLRRGASREAACAALLEENRTKADDPHPEEYVRGIVDEVYGRYGGEQPSFPCTDVGNAERLVWRHGKDLLYCERWRTWLVWDGRRWVEDETGEVNRRAVETVRSVYGEAEKIAEDKERKRVAKWAMDSESSYRIKSMVEQARAMSDIPVRVADFDQDPWLLNVRNGTVDLRTGELLPHRREDLITKLAPVEYDPEAKAPTWEAFLERVIPDEDTRGFLRRAVGYSLTGVVKEKALMFLSGRSDTGKTTFLETVQGVLGEEYAGTAAPELLLAKRNTSHPTELADLLGKRFVATSEVQQGRRLAESLVKQLTGKDKIKARRMREDFFEFVPSHTIWLAANHRPDVRETGDAIWRRIKVVPFGVQIPEEEQDKDLQDKMLAEAAGILAWAVQGYLEWQERGSLGEPEEVKRATEEYREEMDPLADFFEERCAFEPGAWTSKKDLEAAYHSWAQSAKQTPLKWSIVTDYLKEHDCERTKHGRVGWGWKGVRLRVPEMLESDE